MIEITEKGNKVRIGDVEGNGTQRSLTGTEDNYHNKLQNAGIAYAFKHPFYESVKIQSKEEKFLEQLQFSPTYKTQLRVQEEIAKKHPNRIRGHLLQLTSDSHIVTKKYADTYVKWQNDSQNHWTTFIDRNESISNDVSDDLSEMIETTKSAGKTPRALIDMHNPSYEAFTEKTEKAISAGAKSIVFRHASIVDHLDKHRFAHELAKSGVHTHMFGVVRKIPGNRPPASYPSIMALAGHKAITLRQYGAGGGEIDYDRLRLFNEATHGLLTQTEWVREYGNEFETETDFEFMNDAGGVEEIFALTRSIRMHEILLAYESIACQNELQKASETKELGSIIANKKYVGQAIENLGLF